MRNAILNYSSPSSWIVRVLITGAAGFIGKNLVSAAVDKNIEVVAVDISPFQERVEEGVTYLRGDILKPESWLGDVGKIDMTIHLAAQTSVSRSEVNPLNNELTNVIGTLQMLKASVQLRADDFRFTSSSAVYGATSTIPTPEETTPNPISFYGESKLHAEHLISHFSDLNELPSLIYRISNVYGPFQRSDIEGGVVAIFCDRSIKGEDLAIYGNGEQTRDFIFVEDVVSALLFKIKSQKNSTLLNLSTAESTRISDLAGRILKFSDNGKSSLKFMQERIGDIRHSALDNSKLKEIGFLPKISLENGISRTLEFFSTNSKR